MTLEQARQEAIKELIPGTNATLRSYFIIGFNAAFNLQQEKLDACNSGARKPDMELKIWLDTIGIEASVLCDDKEIGGKVRDFSDDHPIETLKESMVRHISEMLNKFMEGK